MSFQNFININPSFAVEGDFALNGAKWTTVNTEEDSFLTGSLGLTIGRFCWIDSNDSRVLNNFGAGEPVGFLHRNQQGLITGFLNGSSLTVQKGFNIGIYAKGAFYARNTEGQSIFGEKVYANLSNGTITTAATGLVIPGYIETDFYVYLDAAINELTIISNLETIYAAGPTPPPPPPPGSSYVMYNGAYITYNGQYIIYTP